MYKYNKPNAAVGIGAYASLCTDLIPCKLFAAKWLLCHSKTVYSKLHCAATVISYF